MKARLLGLVIVLVLALSACGGPDAEVCQLNWNSMEVEAGDEGFYVNLVLNSEWAPDSVGSVIKECIQDGWEGYR